jgi:hypothetical protein
MKKLLLVVSLMLPLSAAADTCTEIASMAEAVMKNRQAGVDVVVMMDIANKSEVKDIATQMIIEAYKRRAYRTEQYQLEAVREFKNEVYLICLQGQA